MHGDHGGISGAGYEDAAACPRDRDGTAEGGAGGGRAKADEHVRLDQP